ncbi:Mannose-P-dolichol utilization defect 1 protein OS=Mus musculus GN=Mpdu1 PE=2 SV=1 [Rhizoctonia solani AG-1 IB]|uniref:Mannose-P-dolichol utilization defect 1 protein homolog n=1 Tax=Thanatephorus cucumeris (strain AG1-IB / isolate 7/3/14) TaxID=1108050 RepID=M5BRE7_THACB|nr:Mannose-P-dolichol utilization defect 1 protein AltName: Full=Suppressor of Lec15 and Lec35 glycosylation mutation homolog [Rhizoctonia solani AG-1 IB]CEL52137.1 Mannose-P-dolichol utilization defect 1 protein OS=Mus musculus GN=Mpdu1 PE=2 SV=1 [Rhizoctonia solani AG-1 IB]
MTSITKNLPFFIREPAVAIIGEKCYITLIENLELDNIDCLKYAISKGLGIGIVVGGTVMKVPQLLLITRARSARGLSLTSYILETLAYAINLAYSARNAFPFSTYGENLFLTIQNVAITYLILQYPTPTLTSATTPRNPHAHFLPFTAATLLLGLVLLFSPAKILAILQISTLPIALFSKLPQIAQNQRARSTGQLSAVAVGAQTLGCLARLFTTATEVDDKLVAGSFALALLLNLVVAAQMALFWGQGVGSEKAQATEKAFLTTPTPIREKVEIQVPQPLSPRTSSPAPQSSGARRWARKID